MGSQAKGELTSIDDDVCIAAAAAACGSSSVFSVERAEAGAGDTAGPRRCAEASGDGSEEDFVVYHSQQYVPLVAAIVTAATAAGDRDVTAPTRTVVVHRIGSNSSLNSNSGQCNFSLSSHRTRH